MAPFTYQPRPADSWDRRAKGSIFESFIKSDFTTFSAKKENSIRILPPTWENPLHYGQDLWIHYSVGPTNATVICLSKMKKTPCPICSAQAKAEQAGNEKDAKELKPTKRVLVWMIDRKEEAEKAGNVKPLLWAMPWTVDRDIAKVCRDRGTGELYQIDHPESGRDVYFDREQKGQAAQNVEYTGFQISSRPSPVDQKHIDYIVKNPLPSTLLWRSYEEVEVLFEGLAAAPESTEVAPTQQTQPPPPPSTPLPPAQTKLYAPPPPPPPTKPFVSEWTNVACVVCGKLQFTTVNGPTCEDGHGPNPEPTNGHAEPAPPPPPPPPSQSNQSSRASTLKGRFETGPKKVQ